MRFLMAVAFLCAFSLTWAQNKMYKYFMPGDSTYFSYALELPSNPKGLVVRDFSNLPDLDKPSYYEFHSLCIEAGLAVLYTNSSNFFPELFVSNKSMNVLDELINSVIKTYNMPKNNIFIGGISASGARALRYVQYCNKGLSKNGIKIKATFSVDSPLDLERFYNSVHNNGHKFKAGMLEEAALMKSVFKKQLSEIEFQSASVYTATDSLGGNAQYLKTTPLMLICEPDMDWWILERGADYYDINAIDMAGLYNQLLSMGNKEVEYITTTNKGFNKQGERNCHSWSIVDEKKLLNWILSYVD